MKAEVISVVFKRPQIILPQREWKQIRKYLAKKYYIIARENGNCILQNKSQIKVEFKAEDGSCECIQMRSTLKRFYGSDKKCEVIYELFKADLEKGKLIFEKQSTGKYSIIEA